MDDFIAVPIAMTDHQYANGNTQTQKHEPLFVV